MLQTVILCIGIAAGTLLAGTCLFHYFQLESYQFPGYFRTVRRNLLKAVLPGFLQALLQMLVLFLLSRIVRSSGSVLPICTAAAAFLASAGWLTGKKCSEKKAKKPFVLTPRVKRLYVLSALILTLMLFFLAKGCDGTSFPNRICFAVFCLFPAFLPLWVAFCGLLAWPLEKAVSECYFRDAQKILRGRKDLIRIGITGSWGKTSVKFILGTILEEKYHTLVTPASYNTPMGVTRVIRSKLEPGHRVFISEMGARHVGDIREMCRLVHPVMGVITSVGPQHLDTFKTVERVAKTKYELIESLPAEGHAFFADDGGLCKTLYQKTKIAKSLTGLNRNLDDPWADEISYSPEGSTFMLHAGDRQIRCATELLGELNIKNILLSCAVALELGLTLEQIARGIRKIRPVEHRLQLIRHPNGLNVIDDAFNSNILGAKQAFEVLKGFPASRIVVTPGMVELGGQEYDLNREFGAAMASCCDTAVLVGKKRSEAIADGLLSEGFPENSIRVVGSLNEAALFLQNSTRPGDTVLFENDLPDNYSES